MQFIDSLDQFLMLGINRINARGHMCLVPDNHSTREFSRRSSGMGMFKAGRHISIGSVF